jgi:hypothetical protein
LNVIHVSRPVEGKLKTKNVQGDQAPAKRQKMLKKFENLSTKTVAEQEKEAREKEIGSEKIKCKKVKVKLSMCLTDETLCHEDIWGSVCIDPRIHFGTSWSKVVSFPPRSLHHRGNSPCYSLARRLGGPQNWSGRRRKEKNLARTGTRTPTSWQSIS